MNHAILSLLLIAAGAYAAPSLKPVDLRTEYRQNPLGIDETRPRLSWKLAASNPSARNLRQSAYRIVVSSTAELASAGKGDLWDTGKVASEQSVHIVYEGKPLSSGQPVWWRVMVWDQDGQPSPWSETARWSMGLLKPEDWKGKWIGRDEKTYYKDPHSPFQWLRNAQWIWFDEGEPARQAPAETRRFRATVTLPQDRALKTATFVLGADNSFELTVNGNAAGRGNNPSLPMVLDVAPWLRPGPNEILVVARNTREDPAGVIGALRVEFVSGDPLIFATGSEWQALRKEEEGWRPAKVLGPYGMDPWGEVGLREEQALPARMLRKEFTVGPRLRRATAYVAGLGLSELYLNGAKAGDHVLSPALSEYEKRVYYVTHDITAMLKPGLNAVGLWLGNGRYWQPRRRIPMPARGFGYPKAIAQIELEYAGGRKETVVTDETWKLTTDGPIRANNEYDGEVYDARMEMPGWAQAGFDDSKWEAAQLVQGPPGALRAQMSEPLRVMETLAPKSMKELRPGVYIYDLGQNMVGWVRLKVQGPAGTRVQMRLAESLRPDGSLYVDNLRSARATLVYILKGGGPEVWEPRFTYHGFRYIELTGYPGKPSLEAVEGRVVHDAMEKAGEWESSHSLLNRIHHNIYWGIRGNYRSIPTDCPQRDEKQGWLGDRSVVSLSESYLFDVAAFYTKWVQDIADSQRPTGSIPDVAPTYWVLYNDGVVWPSTFVLAPQMVYRQYGDLRIIERHYDGMKKWVDYMRGFLKDGIMPRNTYGDWCVPPEDPKLIHSKDPARITAGALLSTAYYHQMVKLVSANARMLGRNGDAAELDRLAAQLKEAFLRTWYKREEARFDNGTQTSSVLPLAFGMVPEEDRGRVFERLVEKIEKESNNHVGVGLVGAQWLMRTLSDNGRPDVAFAISTQTTYPGWGYMVEKGATTVWELWNGDTADPAMNSMNHVMQIGDLAVWMYEYLAGIRPDAEKPGFRHIHIKPYPVEGLSYVKATHRSLYGPISAAWNRTGRGLQMEVTIPPNTTATIWVPSTGKVAEAGGLKPSRTESGFTVFETGSGTYRFTAE
jgi:alpha-L-rhamnosidase